MKLKVTPQEAYLLQVALSDAIDYEASFMQCWEEGKSAESKRIVRKSQVLIDRLRKLNKKIKEQVRDQKCRSKTHRL